MNDVEETTNVNNDLMISRSSKSKNEIEINDQINKRNFNEQCRRINERDQRFNDLKIDMITTCN
jgi:hypothetical protein